MTQSVSPLYQNEINYESGDTIIVWLIIIV
jgi:hypothetical protein